MALNAKPKPKRGATNICAILAVDKPIGMSSHDVVDAVRRFTGEGRVGHAGTLDPAATGLLLVCVGPAARASSLIMAADKVYQARIAFGSATDTDDAQGTVIARAPLADTLADSQFAAQVLANFVGPQQQTPPQFAAIKKNGETAYKAARQGKPLELEPRSVVIHDLKLIKAAPAYWDVEATVSKGTYIRALARDIGEAVGSKAHLASLRRIRSGTVSIEKALSLAELEKGFERCKNNGDPAIRNFFLDPCADVGISPEQLPEGLRHAFYQ